MVRPATHGNGILRCPPQLCAVLAGAVLAIVPGTALGSHTAPQPFGRGSAEARSGPNYLWLWVMGTLEEMLRLLEEDYPPPEAQEGTESEAVGEAQDLSAAYAASGFRSDLSAAEISAGLDDIDALRASMSDDPTFADPYWLSFADTLDQMEAELLLLSPQAGG